MTLSESEIKDLADDLKRLTSTQQEKIKSLIKAFREGCETWRNPISDLITDKVMSAFSDQLINHHLGSRQALSKDRFEFALEYALNESGIPAELVESRTNRGHDISIKNVPVSLKTEASANIKDDYIHVSKWMELGRGEWELKTLLDSFFGHLESYERIFTLRRLRDLSSGTNYELVEIPKALLLEAKSGDLEVKEKSKQNPKPGYCYVKDLDGSLKFSLYFDGGSERKLQIKDLRKSLCIVHATWRVPLFSS